MFEKIEWLTAKDFKPIFNEHFVKPILRKEWFKWSWYIFYKDMWTHFLFFQLLGSSKYWWFSLIFWLYFKEKNCLKKWKELSYHDLDFEKLVTWYYKENNFIKFDFWGNIWEAEGIILNIIKVYKSIWKDFYLNIENYKKQILTVKIDDIRSYLKDWLKVLHESDGMDENKWHIESILLTKMKDINLMRRVEIIGKIFEIDWQIDMSNKILELDKEFLLENHLMRSIYSYLDCKSRWKEKDWEFLNWIKEWILVLEKDFIISKKKWNVIFHDISSLLKKIY